MLLYVKFYHILFREEAESLAKKLKIRLYRTSVKEDFNVSTGTSFTLLY